MGLFSSKPKRDLIGEAIERDYMAEQERQNREARAYVKKHGLEGVVAKSVDDAMDRYREGFRW